MLWHEEDPAHPVYRKFPGATQLCIGEKYPDIAYVHVTYGRCHDYLVAPGGDKPTRLKIVPDTEKYSPHDPIVKWRKGAGVDDVMFQIFANGAYKTSKETWWHKKCFTKAPSSA